jgi:hypothetical protein
MKVFGVAGDVTVTIFRVTLGLSTRNHPKGLDLRDTYVNHYCLRSALLECENVAFDIVVGSKIRLRDLPSRLKALKVFFFVAGGFHMAINSLKENWLGVYLEGLRIENLSSH